MQWFKRFFKMTVTDKGAYDTLGQRARGKGGAEYGTKKDAKTSGLKKVVAPIRKPVVSAPTAAPSALKENTAPVSQQKTVSTTTATKSAPVEKPVKATVPTAVPVVNDNHSGAEIIALKQANDTITKQYNEMKLEMDGLITERDFYFDKLRDVEMILQELEDAGQGTELSAKIFKILYATADGFETAAPVKEVDVIVPAAETVATAEESETF